MQPETTEKQAPKNTNPDILIIFPNDDDKGWTDWGDWNPKDKKENNE